MLPVPGPCCFRSALLPFTIRTILEHDHGRKTFLDLFWIYFPLDRQVCLWRTDDLGRRRDVQCNCS